MKQKNTGNNIFHLLRINHWLKNIVIFVPLFFAGYADDVVMLTYTFWAFVTFCLVASSVYIINDIFDKKSDALHPVKSLRPIASGKVKVSTGIIIAIVLQLIAYSFAFFVNINLLYILLCYFGLNLVYSVKLKNYAITDITIIALGFLLRIFAGGIINDIPISMWLVIMVFLSSLLMGLGKRRDDALLFEEQKIEARKNIKLYTLGFIDISMAVLSSVIIVAYIMYSVSDDLMHRLDSEYVYVTSLFVIYGVLHYLHLSIVQKKSSSPVKVLLNDRSLQLTILLWLISFYFILYYF